MYANKKVKSIIKIILGIVFVFSLTGCLDSQGNPTILPEYKIVLEEFYKNYSTKYFPQNYILEFEKQPTGWNVKIFDFKTKEIIKNEVFWSVKENKFLNLSFTKNEDNTINTANVNTFLTTEYAIYYQILPYFGYEDWASDIIKNYEKLENKSDSILFAIGFSHYIISKNYLSENLSILKTEENFKKISDLSPLNDTQKTKYFEHVNKAKDYFKAIIERNPKFYNYFGFLNEYYSDFVMDSYFNISLFNNEFDNPDIFPDPEYSKFKINLSKNLLNTCDSNSILIFTNASKFYEILYIQKKLNYRNDVILINFQKLIEPVYFKNLKENDELKFDFEINDIDNQDFNMVFIGGLVGGDLNINEAIKFLKDKSNRIDIDGQKVFALSSSNYILSYGEENVKWTNVNSYFLRNDLILMDLLNSNINSKKIYFQDWKNDFTFKYFNKYLSTNGFYQCIDFNNNVNINGIGKIDIDDFNTNYNKIDWSNLKNVSDNDLHSLEFYQIPTYILTQYLISKNKPDSAKLIIDKYYNLLPKKYSENSIYMITIVNLYAQIGENNLSKDILNKLYENTENKNIEELVGLDDNVKLNKETRIALIKNCALKNSIKLDFK